ncbi:hypothetical protein [Lactiplantibacillus plantarum]|uniref:hypothetical protein n=1 Tax=Lactiplantibacillus plantarum TaxID=1590 RepID=UPI001F403B33|nr:hypothetical protein [Lactiplantibacillus plantarum]
MSWSYAKNHQTPILATLENTVEKQKQAILALNKEVTDMDETIKLQQATITRQKEIIKKLQTQVNVLTVLESQLMELQKQLDSTTAD